jgi:hypothetical protein
MAQKKSLIIAAVVLIAQLLLYYSLRSFPAFIERWYSTGIYPFIAKTMRYALGWIPFSIGDVGYAVCIILVLRWLWISKKGLITLSRKRYLQFLTTLNVVIALFQVLWGFNYYRQPLHVTLNKSQTYTLEQLKSTVNEYVAVSNQLHASLQPIDSLPVTFTRSQAELFEIAAPAFEKVPQQELRISMGPTSIKESLLTLPLSYMGYGGYLNPISGEAQTNGYINFYKAPVLILHEMAHQLGYAKENEANFIAINAGKVHSDPYFQYSANVFALNYLLGELAANDMEAFEEAKASMRPGILANYRELRTFWQQYEGVIEDVSQATYNQYLKANNQPGGMQTYSYVVALLVASE